MIIQNVWNINLIIRILVIVWNRKILKHYFCIMTQFKKYIELEEGDFYITPNGYRCFTEQYHLKRGYCCESSCKHCPYDFDAKTGTVKKKSNE